MHGGRVNMKSLFDIMFGPWQWIQKQIMLGNTCAFHSGKCLVWKVQSIVEFSLQSHRCLQIALHNFCMLLLPRITACMGKLRHLTSYFDPYSYTFCPFCDHMPDLMCCVYMLQLCITAWLVGCMWKARPGSSAEGISTLIHCHTSAVAHNNFLCTNLSDVWCYQLQQKIYC